MRATACRPILKIYLYKKTFLVYKNLCKGDIVVRDVKLQRPLFSPFQNFKLPRYRYTKRTLLINGEVYFFVMMNMYKDSYTYSYIAYMA